jgi:hypothetical protein
MRSESSIDRWQRAPAMGTVAESVDSGSELCGIARQGPAFERRGSSLREGRPNTHLAEAMLPRHRHIMEFNLSFIYLVALWGVGIAIVAIMIDAVISVSRPPSWKTMTGPRTLQLVETEDRRTQQIPFVGVDRRAPVAAPALESEREAA